jgi:hypothetical protein
VVNVGVGGLYSTWTIIVLPFQKTANQRYDLTEMLPWIVVETRAMNFVAKAKLSASHVRQGRSRIPA